MAGWSAFTPLGLESVTDQTELKCTRDLIVKLEAAARGVLSTRAQRTFFLNCHQEIKRAVGLQNCVHCNKKKYRGGQISSSKLSYVNLSQTKLLSFHLSSGPTSITKIYQKVNVQNTTCQ